MPTATRQQWKHRVASLAAAFHTFSVKQIVLCVTKMDLVDRHQQEVFEHACKQVLHKTTFERSFSAILSQRNDRLKLPNPGSGQQTTGKLTDNRNYCVQTDQGATA